MTVLIVSTVGGGMLGNLRRERYDRTWSVYAGRLGDANNPWHDTADAPNAQLGVQWPSASGMMSGVGADLNCAGDSGRSGSWSTWVGVSKSSNGLKYIRGQAKDSGGSGISGATIKCFRTSTDELVSTVGSDTNGFYAAPTPYVGENHYIVASGTGVAGVTVNTLVPTNMDGT